MTDSGAASGGNDQDRQQRAQADKAVADARAAQTAAEQAAAQYAEWSSPLARQQREAQARQAVAQASQATASAQQAQISALYPTPARSPRPPPPSRAISRSSARCSPGGRSRRPWTRFAGTIERLVNDQKPSVLLIGLVPPAPELTGVARTAGIMVIVAHEEGGEIVSWKKLYAR